MSISTHHSGPPVPPQMRWVPSFPCTSSLCGSNSPMACHRPSASCTCWSGSGGGRERSQRSYSVERSHLQINQSPIIKIHDLVVVSNTMRKRRDSVHGIVEGRGAQKMASDEIAGNSVVVSLLRMQIVHGEGNVTVESKRYLKGAIPFLPAVGS